ncbi:hypothetical protein [uncultured Parolsenella sp.]|uniref:hypothetical protein n=1 Tax=uncultured Parolsenella sp. TaxID=2083008 RepID=UPI0025F04C00|nr:hypothetical protein [uncultured Parolsenella sp.]
MTNNMYFVSGTSALKPQAAASFTVIGGGKSAALPASENLRSNVASLNAPSLGAREELGGMLAFIVTSIVVLAFWAFTRCVF